MADAKSIDSFVLISLPTVTHALDMNQRNVQVDFETTNDINFSLKAPLNGFIAPPGHYMLFAVANKSESVSGEVKIPSIAKIIHLSE